MTPSTTKSPAQSTLELVDLPYGITRLVTSIIASRKPTLSTSPVEPTGTSKKAVQWLALGVLAAVVSVIVPASAPFLAEVALRTLVQNAYRKDETEAQEEGKQLEVVNRPSSSDIRWAEETAKPMIPTGNFLVAFISARCPTSPVPMRATIIMNHRVLAERAFIRSETDNVLKVQASPVKSSPAKSHKDIAKKSHDSAPTCLGYFARAWDTVVTSSVLDPNADPFKSAAVMLNPDARPFNYATEPVKSTLSPTATPFQSADSATTKKKLSVDAKPFTPIEKTLPAAPVAASMESASMESVSMDSASMESVSMDSASMESVSMESASVESVSIDCASIDTPVSSVRSSASPQKVEHLALYKRVQFLEKVLVRFENYQPTNLLPEGVKLALTKKRQDSSPRVAVDLEILLVKAMIDNIEIGQSTSSIDWDAWWVDVNMTLHDKYCSLAEHFIILANSF